MNPFENLPQELIELIIEKDFSQLNLTEKSLVLSWLSEDEYQKLRFIQHQIIEVEKLNVNKLSKTPKVLLNAFDKKHNKVFIFSNILNKQVPAWQMAASILLFFGLGFMAKKDVTKWPQNSIVYKNTVDTVFQIKTIIDTVKVEKWLPSKEKIVFLEAAKVNYAKPDNSIPLSVPGTYIFTTSDLTNTAKFNSSLAYDSISNKIGFVSL